MNELKSYTEYAVSTPTADFVIGFDFNYGEDAVNVTVDDVPATEAGYTVVYLNETTIQLSPSVPSGVVRLQRETDIDQTDHAYRAGAKFIAQTMDENFEQLRHSQQEVRDGFVKLANDTYEIIDTLNAVGQSAQDAANAAEVAAQLANDAAAQVNDKVSQAELDLVLDPINISIDLAKRGIANRYDPSLVYNSGERIVLTNGDIVKSTINGNINDPNVDMTGWKKTNVISVVETIAQLRLLNNAKEGDLIYVKGFHTPTNFALAQPYEGGGLFLWAGGSTVTPVQGIIEQATGVTNGRFLRQFNDNVVNVLFCGAKREGVTETHSELKIALQFSINNNMPCYAPSGTYLLGNRVDPTLTSGKSIYFYGDGSGLTIFKDRDGLTLELGRFNMSFYFLCPDNATVETMSIKGMRVNKNGVTSPASSPTDYAYEQAHCFGLASTWTNSRIKNLIIDDVVTEDKIGAGICLTQGYFDTVRISNIQGVNYQHIGGQRGDFEFQAVVSDLEVDTGIGKYAQCEPNMLAAPTGYKPKARFTNCSYDITEFTAYVNTPDAQTIILDNHTAKDLCLIRWAKLIATNSTLRVYSSGNNYWEGTAKGSVITDSEIIIGVNTTTNAFDSFYPRSASNVPTYLKFKGGKFTADSTANSTTTGFAVNNGAVYSGAQGYLVAFEDVEFSSAFERTAKCYANGNFTFKRCKLAGRAGSLAALEVGGYSTYYSNVELESNDLSQLGGAYVQYTAANTLWSVNYKGIHDFAKSGFTTSNAANTEACAKADGYFTSDNVPTGKGILGWKVKINKPAFGTGSEFICTTTSSTAPVYQLSTQSGVKMDTTANRPSSLTAASRGLRYLDTTLAASGKPLTYNGSAWVDSTGVVV